jgi:hypothetical protein
MPEKVSEHPEWVLRGKTISELIEELQSFSDQSLLVEISLDDGVTHKPISLVVKSDGRCLLINSENASDE